MFKEPLRTELDGLDVLYPNYWSIPGLTRMHGKAMYYSVLPYTDQIHKEFGFNAIVASWAYPDGYAAGRLAMRYSCPLVIKVLGSDINNMSKIPWMRDRVTMALSRSQRVMAVSKALADGIMALGIEEEKIFIQHNGVDGHRFVIRDKAGARKHLELDADGLLVSYIGRLSPEKGVDVLIEAMGHLRRSGRQPITLLLIGDGPMRASLESRADELDLKQSVRFLGNQPHGQIPYWISASDALCLPSRMEGCPNVVLEALASGRPVAASRVGGVPEILREDCGALVPSDNPQALADAMENVVARQWDPEVLRGSVEYLSWNDVGKAYYDQLTEVLADRDALNRPQSSIRSDATSISTR